MPKQNWGNFYITNNGGFDGFISNIQYFAYKLPYYKLENIIKIGPNTGSCIDSGENLLILIKTGGFYNKLINNFFFIIWFIIRII